MSSAQDQRVPPLRQVEQLETSLLSTINAADDDLQRVNCLDEEQRAEVHAILEAMRHDSESHAATVQFLASQADQEGIRA